MLEYFDNYLFQNLKYFVQDFGRISILILGPPKPVSEVTIIAIAAEQILISFRVGANGGSQQIFHIVIRETESNKETKVNIDYVDPSKGSVLNFTIKNLQPETKYIASVYSSNFYGEKSSDFFQFTTRGNYLLYA